MNLHYANVLIVTFFECFWIGDKKKSRLCCTMSRYQGTSIFCIVSLINLATKYTLSLDGLRSSSMSHFGIVLGAPSCGQSCYGCCANDNQPKLLSCRYVFPIYFDHFLFRKSLLMFYLASNTINMNHTIGQANVFRLSFYARTLKYLADNSVKSQVKGNTEEMEIFALMSDKDSP
ncbi:hypothetical protein K501DRAFT_265526 [Backusella circina FSU 941]|nr:hypothetical protein K501DRAFT_265526 [Backusella circina FSU 941]